MTTCRMIAASLALALTAIPLAAQTVAAPQAEARWFRGNLHTHSLWSDGNDVPEMICAWYKQNGYQFVALSDHNILSNVEKWVDVAMIVKRGGRKWLGRYKKRFGADWVEMRKDDMGKPQVRLKRLEEFRPLLEEPGQFLLLQSEEVSCTHEKLPIHINVTNIREKIRPPKGDSVRDVMRKVLEIVEKQSAATGEPMIAHLNHPNFYYAITAEDLAAVIQERFFEVWNGHPSVHHHGDHHHASVERLWDIANTLRIAKLKAPPLFGLGTDDSHNYFNENPRSSITGRGWVMVRARELTPRALVEAMQRGDFYASSGVALDRMHCTEKVIDLRITAAHGETFTTEFIGTLAGYDDASEPITDDQGKVIRATQRYSSEVGRVLKTVKGLHARYELTGKELYVRAVVTSTGKPSRPVFGDQHKQAWTQPVGWHQRVQR